MAANYAAQAAIESIVGLRLDGGATGDNITAVWLRRGANGWRSFAWPSDQSQGEVLRYIKDELSISDRWDWLWPIDVAQAAAVAPDFFSNGVMFDDPMRGGVESSSDPRGFLEALVQSGYAAAVIDVEIVDIVQGCDEVTVLEIIAQGVELELTMSIEDAGDGMAAMRTNLLAQACIDLCFPWTETIAQGCSGCTNTGWGTLTETQEDYAHCAVLCWYSTQVTCTY